LRQLPRHGAIQRAGDGRLLLQIHDLCLDTCVGRFAGDWVVEVAQGSDAWRLRADRTAVGTSGWVFDGTMESLERGFHVQERG
jgi:hypothetical protein